MMVERRAASLTQQRSIETREALLTEDGVRDPYFEWIGIAGAFIERGAQDGSIRADVDAGAAAEYVNALFVGCQVISGLADGWASFPERFERLIPLWSADLRA